MPTYKYQCKCGNKMEIMLRMVDHRNKWPCSKCDEYANQVIDSAPMVVIPAHMRFDAQGYESPTTGAHITTKKQRIEDMARSGCIEYEPGMRQDADRRVIEHDKYMDKMIDETVEREFDAMPTTKKEQLCNELTAGADIEYTRLTA